MFEHTHPTKINLIYKSNCLRNVKPDLIKADRMHNEKKDPQFSTKKINKMHDKDYIKSNIIKKLSADYENIFMQPKNQNVIGKSHTHLKYSNNEMAVVLMKNKLIEDYKIFLEGPKSVILCIALTSDNKYVALGSDDYTILI